MNKIRECNNAYKLISQLMKAKAQRSGIRVNLTSKQRNRILAKDNHKCTRCGCSHHLQIHHIIKVSDKGTNHESNLITLCAFCHAKIHPEQANFILGQCYKDLLEETCEILGL